MAGVNRVILLGNLGKDPEVRHLEGGVTVANFPMATSETYKDKQGVKQEKTEWHNIVVWRGLADVAEKYLKKGSKIYLEGKLQTRAWEKDGVKRYTTEIVGENFVMLDRKPSTEENNQSGGTTSETSNTSANTGTGSDDLPF